MPSTALPEINLDDPELPIFKRGKIRDIYELDDEHLLFVASDRISAFDCVLSPPIPDKGQILTEISEFWFKQTKHLLANHVVPGGRNRFRDVFERHGDVLEGRAMVVRKVQVIPVECIVRGYLAGSAWRKYSRDGAVEGIELPKGLQKNDRLPKPIFTPTTKAQEGHDQPLTFQDVADQFGSEMANRLESASIELFTFASEVARNAGLILVDTKFEFGLTDDGEFLLIDEVLTPDSSRYWPAESYEDGKALQWDKEYVRQYLLETPWGDTDRTSSPPELPGDVVAELRRRYEALRDRLLGNPAVA